MTKMTSFKPEHFQWQVEGKVARVQLSRPERKNPLTFESYAELRDTFPEVAAKLGSGDVWTREAERALIERFWRP